VDPSIRAEVWKYLLNFYPVDSTLEQREQLRKLREYALPKSINQSINQASNQSMQSINGIDRCMFAHNAFNTEPSTLFIERNGKQSHRNKRQTLPNSDLANTRLVCIEHRSSHGAHGNKYNNADGTRVFLADKDVVRTDRSWEYYEGEDNPNLKILYNVLLTYTFYNFDLGKSMHC
jgi:hypothetical protein